MTIPELAELIAGAEGRSVPFHNPVMEIHKKFSIPVACLVFALVGVGLGVSNRKDGKLASFVLGIAVIFVYYVIMFTRAGHDQGRADAGVAGDVDAQHRPGRGRGRAARLAVAAASTEPPLASAVAPLAAWRASASRSTRPTAGSDAGSAARAATRRPSSIRIPQFELPRPNLLDLYVARTYVRMLVMCIVGHAWACSTSRRSSTSPTSCSRDRSRSAMILPFLWWKTPQFLYYIIAIAVLLAAIVTIGLLTKNSELIVMRACGISIYRTAVPLLVFAVAASGVLFAFEERVLAISNRRADYLNHIIRGGSRRPSTC